MSDILNRRVDDVVRDGHLVQKRFDYYGADTEDPNYVVHTGTAQAGSGTSVTLASSASATDDAYNGYGFRVDSGTGSGQDHARITDYNGTTKVATLSSALTTALSTDSVYSIIDRGY